jgi:hypothetical protein
MNVAQAGGAGICNLLGKPNFMFPLLNLFLGFFLKKGMSGERRGSDL